MTDTGFTLPTYAKLTSRGLELDVSVIPNAARTEAIGLHDGALRVRLQAPPADGKANEALLRWLAEGVGIRRAAVHLLRGQTSRRKTVLLECDAGPALLARLADLLPPGAA